MQPCAVLTGDWGTTSYTIRTAGGTNSITITPPVE
jgi:hypothetical protein